jgi:glycine/D-amino acid oxidase-like deaminating enzyme
MKKIIVFAIGLLSLIYMLNPGFGLFEFIPDNFPLIGHLDESTANFFFFSALSYFGLDLTDVFGSRKLRSK